MENKIKRKKNRHDQICVFETTDFRLESDLKRKTEYNLTIMRPLQLSK